jgi:hypothetical protein
MPTSEQNRRINPTDTNGLGSPEGKQLFKTVVAGALVASIVIYDGISTRNEYVAMVESLEKNNQCYPTEVYNKELMNNLKDGYERRIALDSAAVTLGGKATVESLFELNKEKILFFLFRPRKKKNPNTTQKK